MAKITYNPKKLKPGEVRISAGKPKPTAKQLRTKAASKLGGMAGQAVSDINSIRTRGIVPGAKHRSD